MDLFWPAAAFYTAWWVLHLIWFIVSGKYHSAETTGHDNMYYWMMSMYGKNCGYDKKYPHALKPIFIYNMWHLVSSLICCIYPYILFQNERIHFTWLFLLFSTILWRGC